MILMTFLFWFVLGVPTGLVFLRSGRRDLALAAIPFAGALAFLLPVIAAAWTAGSYAGWWWKSLLSAVLIGGVCRLLLGRSTAPQTRRAAKTSLDWLVHVAGAITLLMFVVLGSLLSAGWPGFGWDGLSIWLLHARLITEYTAFPADVFASSQLWRSHMDYPLLVPALYARLLPSAVPMYKASMVIGVVLAAVPAALFVGLRRYLPVSLAAAAAFAPLIGIPATNHYHAYADCLLVLFGAGGFLLLLLGVFHSDRGASVLGTLMLACAASTKNEGMVWLFCAVTGVALLRLVLTRDLKQTVLRALAVGVPALFPALLWRGACARLGIENDLSASFQVDLLADRLRIVLGGTYWHFVAHDKWVLLGIAATIAWLMFRRANRVPLRHVVATLCAPGLYLAGLLAVYVGTPYDLAWHLRTSMGRTTGMILPAMIVAVLAMYSMHSMSMESRRYTS